LIQVNNLTKIYHTKSYSGIFKKNVSSKISIENLSFGIEKGEFVGFLGPNGAGKSTAIKMLSGVLFPTSGHVYVTGLEPYKYRKKIALNIGVIQGHRSQLWQDLPLKDSFYFLKCIYKVPDDLYKKNLDEFCELLRLKEFWDTPVRNLSLGQRMRGELAGVLLHNPNILFLDEPTIGLDVNAKISIQNYLRYINKTRETTILLTTHNIDDIERLCNRVICINEGSKVFDGHVNEMIKQFGEKRQMIIEVDSLINKETFPYLNVSSNEFFIDINNESDITMYIDRIREFYKITNISINEPSLEKIISNMYLQK
jgi:ABC-2 type transport system ATP-binding protein